jgi:hypothetical protein
MKLLGFICRLLTSVGEIGIWVDDVVAIFVVDLLVLGEILRNISNC